MLAYIYIDNSNFFNEGQRFSAVKKGMALNIWDAMKRDIFDFLWLPDYGELHEIVCKNGHSIGSVKMWGSPTPNDTFWAKQEKEGFQVKTYDKSYGKEKIVDTSIVTQMIEDSFSIDKLIGEICLIAGDKDYVPAVESLKKRGYIVNVFFWGHAAPELQKAASKFINLNDYFDDLKFGKS